MSFQHKNINTTFPPPKKILNETRQAAGIFLTGKIKCSYCNRISLTVDFGKMTKKTEKRSKFCIVKPKNNRNRNGATCYESLIKNKT